MSTHTCMNMLCKKLNTLNGFKRARMRIMYNGHDMGNEVKPNLKVCRTVKMTSVHYEDGRKTVNFLTNEEKFNCI